MRLTLPAYCRVLSNSLMMFTRWLSLTLAIARSLISARTFSFEMLATVIAATGASGLMGLISSNAHSERAFFILALKRLSLLGRRLPMRACSCIAGRHSFNSRIEMANEKSAALASFSGHFCLKMLVDIALLCFG
jgi:hypothetical protein